MSQSIDRSAQSRTDLLAGHHPLGVSTGVFDDLRGAWRQLVVAACGVSTYVVELSALSGAELPGLLAYLGGDPRLPFRYVSVHAPVKNRGVPDAAAARVLGELPLWVRSIVTHPDALLELHPYRELGTSQRTERPYGARRSAPPSEARARQPTSPDR